MMFVAGLQNVTAIQPHAQARAKQGLLDVVRGERIAGKQAVDVAAADQTRHVLDAAGVNDGWSTDEQRLAPFLASANQFEGNLPDCYPLGLLGRDGAVHEFEAM